MEFSNGLRTRRFSTFLSTDGCCLPSEGPHLADTETPPTLLVFPSEILSQYKNCPLWHFYSLRFPLMFFFVVQCWVAAVALSANGQANMLLLADAAAADVMHALFPHCKQSPALTGRLFRRGKPT